MMVTFCSLCLLSLDFFTFFFFKQKTAYEMRISDWSSDVCSSDLPREAETASARAAKACGIPFGLSMLSLAPMEEISRESGSPFWFHVQPMKDRGLLRSLLDRALALQSPVLIFTVDWPIPSQNHRNIRNRLGQHTARGLVQEIGRAHV